MIKKKQGQSIKYSMVESIILYVLVPLFLALSTLCFLLQYTTSSGISEAFQMMFSQSVREINSAILQSNYVSSTLITYTENNKLLTDYYNAGNDYEKNVAAKQIGKMIMNSTVSVLGNFQGEMIILMNDGRMISSGKVADAPDDLSERSWYKAMKKNGQYPYWDNDINELFGQDNTGEYAAFGRVLMRYQEHPLGYVLVRIPQEVFSRFGDDSRFRKGTIVMFDSNGRILLGDMEVAPESVIRDVYDRWQSSGKKQGRYGSYYVMVSPLSSSSNIVMYIGDVHSIFSRSEQILSYMILFMVIIAIGVVVMVLSISRYITKPILFFADRVRYIENNEPQQLTLKENHFLETRALEEGILRAQQRIMLLMDEVRQETSMKEKARFDALRAQINPHFLFNTLNAIRWKASINQDNEVADILSELGVLLGETYKNDDELESIDHAIRILEAYVKIMKVRFGNEVQFFFVIPEQIREYLVPRFCLQPLVENSFIHGMSHVEKGIIALRGELCDGEVILTLIDNGVGTGGRVPSLTEETNKRGVTGIGLTNIHKRIQTLYGERYGLTIDTELEVGFKVALRIPAMKGTVNTHEGADCRG